MRRAALILLLLVAPGPVAEPAQGRFAITGRIALPGGEPAAGVAVELVAQTSAYDFGRLALAGRHYPEPVARAITGSDGRYRIDAAEVGMWHLYVAPDGYRPMEFYFLPLLRDRLVPTLELTPESAVTVRILGDDGRPLSGAHVRAESPPRKRRAFGRPDEWRSAYRQAFADLSGRVVLGRGADESLHVYAFAPGHLEAERSGIRSSSVELRLEAARPRRIEVRDGRDQPVADALFRLGDRRWPAGVTDETGQIELPLPAEGKPRMHVIGALGGRAETWFDLSAAADGQPLPITLPAPDRRFGQVVDRATRRPIPGAFAWIGGRPADAVRTDSSGGFALDLPSTDSSAWVWGAAEGYIKDVLKFSPGEEAVGEAAEVGMSLALQRAIEARGTVVDADGDPVPDVSVTADIAPAARSRSTAWRASTNLDPAVTDAAGRFSIGQLHPEVSYLVRAHKPGFAPAEIELPHPATDVANDLRFVLEQGRVAIGTVVDQGGLPVAGARIALEKSVPSGPMRSVMMARAHGDAPVIEGFTDEAGRFAIPELPAGTFDLEASASGYAPASVPSLDLTIGSGEVDLGEIVLEPGAAIEGRVVDLRGSALEGAEVFAVESMTQAAFMIVNRLDETEPVARSDANGLFTVPDRRSGEQVDLTVRLRGFANGRLLAVEAPSYRSVEIRLSRSSKVSGRVVDQSGRGVGGAHVWVQTQVTVGPMSSSSNTGPSTTDDDGRFVIEEVEPGEIQLSARAEGFRETRLSDLAVAPEEDLEGVRLVLEPGATISGRVRDAQGRPVADAMILLTEGGRMYSGSRIGDNTDGQGRYRLDGVAPGRRSITARHDDYQPTTREIQVELGDNSLDLTFEGGAAISGRVVDDTGQAVAGAEVELLPIALTGWLPQASVTDTSGEFEIGGVAEGTFTVRAAKEGFAPGVVEDVEVGSGDVAGLEIRLEQGSSIVGRLIGLEPAEYATVQVMAVRMPAEVSMGRVDREGSYRIDDLRPGDYTVRAQVGMGAQAAHESVTVEPGVGETLLDLEFESGLTLSGVVLKGGEPLVGAMVTAAGTDVASNSTGTTSSEGRFELSGLEPGRHVLSVTNFQTGLNHREELEVESDRDVVVEVRVSRVSGTVRDATDSTALAGATVRLESLEGESTLQGFPLQSSVTTDSAGFFRFAQASAGTHRIVAQKDGYAPTETTLNVLDGLDLDQVEIVLEPTEGLRVFVTLPSGQPAGEFFAAAVDAAGQTLVSGIYSAGRDGAHLSLPPGDWELLVSTRETAVSSIRVSLPSRPVSVALQERAHLAVQVPELAGDPALAMLRVTRPDGTPFRSLQWTWIRSEFPMAGGEGAVPGIGPGRWLIRVETSDGRAWQGEANLAPGPNPPLVLQ